MSARGSDRSPQLYTSVLVYGAVQIAFISFLCSYYGVDTRSIVWPPIKWTMDHIADIPIVEKTLNSVAEYFTYEAGSGHPRSKHKSKDPSKKANSGPSNLHHPLDADLSHLPVFTSEQLSLFDGSRPSKDVYLAILGRVYNVQRGSKHYASGGGYHFFAGKDATRAFVTGDFTEGGLVDDVTGLNNRDLLGILDWSRFYEKDYQLVGLLQGTYYDASGQITQRMREVIALMEDASHWKAQQKKQAEVFPPCNSEWHKDSGGRVWCSSKSGGIQREWSGLPRKLFNPGSKTFRCACVKNFGAPLSSFPNSDEKSNRGDLENPNLHEYSGCAPTANSCKIISD